ncbi:MAG: hypothetical protein HQL90_13095 [Magnetococcales bacterium]|nr:hypothetical protein [Magnetococcales bacterium]
MTKFFHGPLVLCTLLLTSGLPQTAEAFVLGELQRLSKAGEPFRATAPITVEPGEKIVTVDMGGDPDYQLLNLSRKAVVNDITVKLQEENDHLQVALHSGKPIQEQDFHILLRVSSNHHTYFPFFHVQPLAQASNNQTPAPSPQPATSPPEPLREAPKTAPAAAKKLTYGPVRPREGLRGIAYHFLKENDLTITQMEVAIWQRNPKHFIRNNMNGLKTGGLLVIPSPEEVARLGRQLAETTSEAHAAEWKKPPKMRLAAMPMLPIPEAVVAAQEPVKEAQPPRTAQPVVQESSLEPLHASIQEPAKESVKPVAEPVKEPVKKPEKPVAEPAKPVAEAVKDAEKPVAEPAKEPNKEPAGELAKKEKADSAPEPTKTDDAETPREQVKVESGALKAILVQLQVITRVLENHHDRQEQLEKRVANLEKNQEQRDQLEKRVSMLERAMKEWNFLTKGRSEGSAANKTAEKSTP